MHCFVRSSMCELAGEKWFHSCTIHWLGQRWGMFQSLTCFFAALFLSVQDLCIKVVASNFESAPTFGPLPDKYVKKITDILALDLPLELAGTVSLRMC